MSLYRMHRCARVGLLLHFPHLIKTILKIPSSLDVKQGPYPSSAGSWHKHLSLLRYFTASIICHFPGPFISICPFTDFSLFYLQTVWNMQIRFVPDHRPFLVQRAWTNSLISLLVSSHTPDAEWFSLPCGMVEST